MSLHPETQRLRILGMRVDIHRSVGSNIGYLSAVAAAQVGTVGRILSFEPAPRYFARLAAVRAGIEMGRFIIRH